MSDPNANRPGYKKTKVGWIPKEWSLDRLGNLVSITSGRCPSDYCLSRTGKFPFVKVDDLNSSVRFQNGSKEYADEGAGLIPKGATLFAKRGAAIETNKVRLSGVQLFMDTNMMALIPNRDSLFPEFLFYSISFQNLYRIADTSPIPQINNKHINPHRIPLPSINEQARITAVLSTCDEAIEKTGDLIKAKQRQKKALMQQLLTGKKRLPGFEGEWTKVRIGDLFEEVSRPVEWDDQKMYKLVSVRRRSGGLFFREALHGKDILSKVMNTTHTGDFLISKMQVIHGAMAMTPTEFDGGHVSGSYITLVTKDGAPIHTPFFDYLSRTDWLYHLTFISSYGVVIEKMTFNLTDFLKKSIEIPPTIQEQERICDLLKTCENEESALGRKLSALKQQKKALMQKLLTGQVRVKV